MDTTVMEGQQSVIRETAGRRKRRREVNRKLKKETTFPGEVIQSDQGVEKLLERIQIQRDLPQSRLKRHFA